MTDLNTQTNTEEKLRNKLLNQVALAGREAGQGSRSLAIVARICVEGGARREFSSDKPKSGSSDVEVIWDRYAQNYGTKSAYSSPAQQKSKLNAFIKLGQQTKFGDSVELFDRAHRVWEKAKDQEEDTGIKILDEFKAMLQVAYAHNKDGVVRELTKEEIYEVIRKPDGKNDTLEALAKRALTAVEKIQKLDDLDEDAAEQASSISKALEGLIAFAVNLAEKAERAEQLTKTMSNMGADELARIAAFLAAKKPQLVAAE